MVGREGTRGMRGGSRGYCPCHHWCWRSRCPCHPCSHCSCCTCSHCPHSRCCCCCWPAPTCSLLLVLICTCRPSFARAGLRLHWPGPLLMAPCLLLSVATHLALCHCRSCRCHQWCCRCCHCCCHCAYGLVVSPVHVHLPCACPSLCGTLPVTEQLVIYCLFCDYLSILDSTYLQSK